MTFASENTLMKLLKLLLLFILALMSGNLIMAQSGIKGIVSDKITGETLIGANVVIDSISPVIGASTQLDGDYTLTIQPGTYTIKCSFVSYKTKVVTGVVVKEGEYTEVHFVLDQAEGTELFEIDVVESKINNTENAVLMDIKKASQVAVGVSGQEIAKSNFRDASEVARRLPGVTVIDNRFVMVRGLSERYNEVWVNNGTTPSVEPDVKAFSFDLIPSNALDRFLIYKTGAPELPGNFAGGAVKIFTKDMPEKNFIQLNYSASYRAQTTFNDAITLDKKQGDWIGMSARQRGIPEGFPNVNLLTLSPSELQAAGQLFSNNWKPENVSKMPLDNRFGIAGAWRKNFKKVQVGMNTGANYSNTWEYRDVKLLQANFNEATNVYDTFVYNRDDRYIHQIRAGFVSNWNLKFGNNHSFHFKNLINQTGTSTAFIRTQNNKAGGYEAQLIEQRYQERGIYVGQLGAVHRFADDKTIIDWNYTYAASHRSDPDLRRIRRNLDLNDPSDPRYGMYYLPSPGSDPNTAGRFYLDLEENIHAFALNAEQKIVLGEEADFIPTIKFGGFYEDKKRAFNMRSFGFRASSIFTFDQNIAYQPLDSLFIPEHINSTTGYQIVDATKPADSYSASNRLLAYYLGINLPVTKKFNVYTGVRVEDNIQTLNSFDRITSERINTVIDKTDLLPSINASYNFTDKALVRIAYAKTINRPEFRELAPFPFLNFDFNALYYGNDTLVNCYIHNFDARYEFYPAPGETFSLGGFYKKFENPIENIIIPTGGQNDFSYQNALSAVSYGVELDIRKSFSEKGDKMKSGFLSNLSMVMNASYIWSKVELNTTGFQENERPMQGQSPFIVNGGLFYQNDTLDLSVNLLYNVIGPRIIFVGNDLDPDVYEMPRNILDLTITKGIGKNIKLRFSVNDLLNQPILFVQDGNANGKLERDTDLHFMSYKRGSYYTLGVTFRIEGKEPKKP